MALTALIDTRRIPGKGRAGLDTPEDRPNEALIDTRRIPRKRHRRAYFCTSPIFVHVSDFGGRRVSASGCEGASFCWPAG